MPIQSLDAYDMSAERGFLCRYDAGAVVFDEDWLLASEVAMTLPQVMPSGQVRTFLEEELPGGDIVDDLPRLNDQQARMAMVHYSFMVQAYVWGEPDAPTSLPEVLARPMVALADRLGQQPLLPYTGYVLDNWSMIDPDGPIDLSNTYMIQNFLSGLDEAWFVLVHVAIEARAGAALDAFGRIVAHVEAGNAAGVQDELEAMADVWKDINAIFDRMPEACDPYIYFERVRPYIHGWKDNPALPNGLIYEGVEKYNGQPQAFRGQTGSQSSIVPSMDALLGVGHAADPLKAYLDELHIYRPPGHRRFIEDVRASSNLRAFVSEQGNPDLTQAYNAIVQAVADFRSRHLEYAASYINKQNRGATGNDVEVGTGGTPFMKYLKKHRDETRERLLAV
jgi:indoleamine 2,3-dioxygenase